MLRQNNKASLLPSLVQPTNQHDDKDGESILNIVIDVGYLLRKVVGQKMAPTIAYCRDTFLMSQKSMSTAQKNKFSIKDFFSKCDQICSFLRIWSHLLKKYLMENFNFCAVGLISVVFDGYGHSSTKDHEHKRRERSHPPCPDVQIKQYIQLQYNQSLLFTSDSNNTQLIDLLMLQRKLVTL